MAVPDRLCVITYVSQLHAHFKNCQPDDGLVASEKKEAIGRNWRDKAGMLNDLNLSRHNLRLRISVLISFPSLR